MNKQSKNYIGFVNDHSGSMRSIAQAAMKDYNINIAAVKAAATREELDTVVSVVGLGYPRDSMVTRQVVISNPHVLKPITSWSTEGGTPLYDGIGNMIELLKGLPDADDPHVSFLVMITTDGEERHSKKYTKDSLAFLIKQVQDTGCWTIVFRVPRGHVSSVTGLGVPLDNIQEWDTTAKGMEASTVVNTQAMDGFFAARSAGAKSSGSFYTNTANVNVAALVEIPDKEISLYVVPDEFNGKWIRDFILTKRMEYLKGAAFFQLTKTENKVGFDKMVLIRDRATGKFFGGADARTMIGLPSDRNARLNPGDHGKFDIFIQSKSINRHLVTGTGVAYWAKIGTPFTQAEIELYTMPAVPKTSAPAPVQLPQVTPTNKPTKSPLVPTPRPQVLFFATRDEARDWSRTNGKPHGDAGSGAEKGKRFYVNP